ncbi:MAG: KEOPS complex subunit Pcc1 [Candidatus Thorarchaeota archaeon]
MVKENGTDANQPYPYSLRVALQLRNGQHRDAVLTALMPEFAAIDSKRVRLLNKTTDNEIVFHLTAKDVTALRAAATSLIRLYLVADGVHILTVKKNE